MNIPQEASKLLSTLGVDLKAHSGKDLVVRSPIDGSILASLAFDSTAELNQKIVAAEQAFALWREVPAPKRGELIRLFGEDLRTAKEPLAKLVTIECGKILEEGRGEVQEMIDICDFAVGLSRQLYGLTIASERTHHAMQENWLPLGVVGIISAFNFPVAVWAWNAALAIVCGDPVLWKPSEKTPLTALACQALFEKALARYNKQGGKAPRDLSSVVIADAKLGEKLVNDKRIPLISATGSTRMGAAVGPLVANRFGKSLLELGGNNAVIVSKHADLDVALPSILFGSVGTAGQRCTTTRRVIAHISLYDSLCKTLEKAFANLAKHKIGNPLDKNTLIGPLIDKTAYEHFEAALAQAKKEGGMITGGKRALVKAFPNGYYVEPALVRMKKQSNVVKKETFAPIVYVMPYSTLEQALEMNNDVPQGLSSAIFTTDVREAEYFKLHSDCGIANVNIGTSGAEIGGAFGGEKETGGGRESGSDSWKAYMRRQTSTTYYSHKKPELAQGIRFDAD
ncbi:MAG: aldehyde dehydrogenase family protein [Proteobacteria bacterium]|nr:aldehyde dehydrogenase family protein [Pseudomonadota bacterium]